MQCYFDLLSSFNSFDRGFLGLLLGFLLRPRLELGEDAAHLLARPRSLGQGPELVVGVFSSADNLQYYMASIYVLHIKESVVSDDFYVQYYVYYLRRKTVCVSEAPCHYHYVISTWPQANFQKQTGSTF